MHTFERDFFVSRICSGYIRCKLNNGIFKLKSFDKEGLYEASEIYYNTYRECQSEGILTDDDAKQLLIDSDKWSDFLQNKLDETIPKYIENCKMEMVDSFNDKVYLEKLRDYLRKAEKELLELFSIRHSLDHLTCHGVASFTKFQFLVSKYCEPEPNPNEILGYLNNNQISEKIVRELARTDPWRTIWACKKAGNLFSVPSSEFSDEQKRLIGWTLMYDSVFESTECPRDDIINDDDVFDGWIIKRRKKNEVEQVKNEYEAKMSKHSNATEVFFTVSDKDPAAIRPEEVKLADSLNTESSKAIIRNRLETIKKHGQVSELDFSDVRTAIEMQINRGK